MNFIRLYKQRLHTVILAIFYCCLLNISFGYSQGKPQSILEEEVKNERVRLIKTYDYVIEEYEKELGTNIKNGYFLDPENPDTNVYNFYRYHRWIKRMNRKELYNSQKIKNNNFIFSEFYIKKIYEAGKKLRELEDNIANFKLYKSIDRKIYALNTVEDSSIVLEIGGGYRDIAFDVFKEKSGIAFYESEIDKDAARMMDDFYQNKPYLDEKGNRFYSVFSSEKSIELEDIKFDYIIMVSTFHHFHYPEAMLRSIKKSCHATTRIMVYEEFEPFFSFEPFENAYIFNSICNDAMQKKEVLALFKKHGFELKEEKKTSSTTRYFRFEVRN